MVPCKLFPCNVVALALYYCCFQQVILCVSSNGYANSTASCSSSFMQCGKLGNITYPFWGSASCAASPSYVLSNCKTSSSTETYWDSFSYTALGVVGSPALTAVEASTGQSTIQLFWNKTLIGLDFCAPPFSSTDLALHNIPSSINLSRMPDGSALEFSSRSSYLFFNCTNVNGTDAVGQFGFQEKIYDYNWFNSRYYSLYRSQYYSPYRYRRSGCEQYKGLCTWLAPNTSCIDLQLGSNVKEVQLQNVLESLACSHFMFGVDSFNGFERRGRWTTGSIELIWRDIQCEKCESAGGYCIFEEKFHYCKCCELDVAFDFNTQRCDCHGLLQRNTSSGAKNDFLVAAIVVVVLGILVVIWVKLRGMIRQSMRVGFLSFIKVTIPIAINVLKKTVRKLQSVSIGPHITIDFDGLTERPMEYSYSSIASATKSFSSLVGEGGFGKVYRGTITQASSHGGSAELQIAVKRSKHSKKQFLNEVVSIGSIHHVNVVRLVGFCMQEDHEMLVYEYVVNGSLDRWLFDRKWEAQKQVLDWGQRYAIALGIARGLTYLHEECRHRTVHCDIKPQNILLDEDMHPKIADFGLARVMGRDESKVMTIAKGTPGYVAPEFWMVGESQLSTKFDVYSYGMVLLELISGQRNFRHDAAASHSSNFPAVAFKAATAGDLESILDARLGITSDGHGVDEAEKRAQWQQIKTAVFVALWCIQDRAARRPCMSEVVKYLEGGAAVSESPPQPNISIFAAPSIYIPQESPCSNCHNAYDCTPLSVGR